MMLENSYDNFIQINYLLYICENFEESKLSDEEQTKNLFLMILNNIDENSNKFD